MPARDIGAGERRAAEKPAVRRRTPDPRPLAPRVRRALGCAAVLTVCAVFPVFVNNAIGYVPLGCAVFSLVLSWAYLQVAARSLDCTQAVRYREVVRGEADDLAVTVRNTSRLVLFHVEHSFVIEDGEGGAADTVRTRTALAPREERPLGLGVDFDHVGTYTVGIAGAEVFDLFGAFSKVVPVDGRCQVRVVPRVHRLDSLGGSELTTTEAARSVRTALSDDMDYAHVREYQLGDPMKTVHWKLSARACAEEGQLYTKLFESHTNPGTTVLLDFFSTQADAEVRACLYDAMLEAAFSIIDYARRAGVQTCLVFRDKAGAVRSVLENDPEELDLLIEDMPRLNAGIAREAAGDMLDGATRDPDAQANFVFVTSELTQQTVEALLRHRHFRRGLKVVYALPANLDGAGRRERMQPVERLAGALVPCVCIEDGSDVAKAVGA